MKTAKSRNDMWYLISYLLSCLIWQLISYPILHDIMPNVRHHIMLDFQSDIFHVFKVAGLIRLLKVKLRPEIPNLKHKILISFCLSQRKSFTNFLLAFMVNTFFQLQYMRFRRAPVQLRLQMSTLLRHAHQSAQWKSHDGWQHEDSVAKYDLPIARSCWTRGEM